MNLVILLFGTTSTTLITLVLHSNYVLHRLVEKMDPHHAAW
jgi:hypothetical protein